MKIHRIFPEALAHANLGRKLTESEINQLRNCEKTHRGFYQQSSSDRILEHPDLIDLQEDLMKIFENFVYNELALDSINSWTIDRSFVRLFEVGEHEIAHRHLNHDFVLEFCFRSKPGDCMEFYRDYKFRDALVADFRDINSSSWTIPLEESDVVVFDSKLAHAWSACRHVYRRQILTVLFRPLLPFRTYDNLGEVLG